MKLAFMDTETTGVSREDRLCQLAFRTYDVDNTDDVTDHNALYKPPLGIKFTAMAVHHITEKMVADKPVFTECEEYDRLSRLFSDKDAVTVAHNAQYDIGMLKKEGINCSRHICTYKIACFLDKQGKLDSYSLQYLRYRFGLEIDAVAHDAWGDILVLEAFFMNHLLRNLSIEEMIEISSRPVLIPRIKFGKHRGKLFSEIPKDYLSWIVDKSDMEENIKYTAGYWLGN